MELKESSAAAGGRSGSSKLQKFASSQLEEGARTILLCTKVYYGLLRTCRGPI